MARARVVTVKGANVRIGDFLITDEWASSHGYPCGFTVESIINLGHGMFGDVLDVSGTKGNRVTMHGDDRPKVERTYDTV